MGGSRFATGPDPLDTPRMPPAIYNAVKRQCGEALLRLYDRIGTPVEGPGKLDHGDVDMLVWGRSGVEAQRNDETLSGKTPLGDSVKTMQTWNSIGNVLGAVRMAQEQDNSANFAIPWPENVPLRPEETDASGTPGAGVDASSSTRTTTGTSKKYIQVDVRICDTEEELEWMLFKHGHGDFWNLLGSTIRPYGLTIDDTALSIRVPEIEKFNKKRARVELSRDPRAVLDFLGIEGFPGRPFASLNAMFECAAMCWLFWVRPAGSRYDGAAGVVGSDEGRFDLKSNDRKRMQTRPAFRIWQDEFIPACRDAGRFAPPPGLTTDDVAEDVRTQAFAAFPGVRETFEARRAEFIAEKQHEAVLKAIKGGVPADLDSWLRGQMIAALRTIILQGDYSLKIKPDVPLRNDEGSWIVENVREFVSSRWRDVLATQTRSQAKTWDEGLVVEKINENVEDNPDITPPELHDAMIAELKKIVLQGNETLGVIPEKPLRRPDGSFILEDVISFVQEHWEDVMRRYVKRNKRLVRDWNARHLERMTVRVPFPPDEERSAGVDGGGLFSRLALFPG